MPRNHQIWPEFGISDHCWLIWCPVDGLAGGCGARAVSRKTPIYFIYLCILYIFLGSLHCIAPKMSYTIPFNLFNAHVTQSTIHRFQAAMDLDPHFILLPACDRQIAQKPSKHLQTSSEQQGKWSRHKNS